jgi:hypothetical protein
MAYGRDGNAPKEHEVLEIPKDHKETTCNCCGCQIIVKPKADIPDDCPRCRHGKLQSSQQKRRIRRN